LAAVMRTPPDGDDDEARFRLRCPRRVRLLWQQVVELARRMAGSELTQGQAAEAIAAEGLSARLPCDESWPATEAPRTPPADPDETRAVFAELDWSAIREALPDDVDGLDADANTLDPFALDGRMRAALHAMRRADWQLGRLLRVFLDRRLYRLMEFPSAERYVTERLGLSARRRAPSSPSSGRRGRPTRSARRTGRASCPG